MSVTVLGIDTSNYTTSAAVCVDGVIVENVKLPLPVKPGEVGLRQSDAVFAHTVNLPEVFGMINTDLSGISAVGYSDRPRNTEGSYMPCFLCGQAAAYAAAKTSGVPVYRNSHQEGHIKAAVYSSGMPAAEEFYAYHLSGGTLELLDVRSTDCGYECGIAGKTLDVTAGQIIDRTGVMLGLPFPCGMHVDRLACANTEKLPEIRISVKGTECNLSGLQNKAEKLFSENRSKELICAYVLEAIKRTVDKMTENALELKRLPILFSGGVASDSLLKSYFKTKYGAYFAEPAFSADNAAGTALLTYDRYINGK